MLCNFNIFEQNAIEKLLYVAEKLRGAPCHLLRNVSCKRQN